MRAKSRDALSSFVLLAFIQLTEFTYLQRRLITPDASVFLAFLRASGYRVICSRIETRKLACSSTYVPRYFSVGTPLASFPRSPSPSSTVVGKIIEEVSKVKVVWKSVSHCPKANYPVAGLHNY